MHDPGIPITKHARTLLGLFQVADFAVSGEVVNQPFRPRARVLQLLGDELIGSPRLAVFELVKNAYDADANEVVVRLELATVGDSAIVVADDGEGTSLDVLRSVWLASRGRSPAPPATGPAAFATASPASARREGTRTLRRPQTRQPHHAYHAGPRLRRVCRGYRLERRIVESRRGAPGRRWGE